MHAIFPTFWAVQPRGWLAPTSRRSNKSRWLSNWRWLVRRTRTDNEQETRTMNLALEKHDTGLGADRVTISSGTNKLLWAIQGLLALLFVFAGVMKFVMPVEEMTKQMPLSGGFLHFIGAAEVLGGLGLVLPGIFRIRQGLTPLAAAGLLIIMIGAVAVTLKTGGVTSAIMPFVTLLLLGFVGYRRWRQLV
jgi:DoxX-like family